MSARRLLHCLAALAVGCLAAFAATAAEPPTAPQLSIDPGDHTAPIHRIATDRAGRWLVTAGSDKTARVWDLASGRLVSTLRPPIGAGNEGKLFAVAVSPDGETVALGGWTGHAWDKSIAIYLFERATGRLRQRLTGLEDVVYDLSFSADGRRLAVSLAGASGIRVFTLPDGRLLGADRDYGGITSAIEFSPDGTRVVSASVDGSLRVHDVGPAGLTLRAKKPGPGGTRPYLATFSPDGRWLAVGYDDTTAVDLLDATSLERRFAPDTSGAGGNLSTPAWSRDGAWLYAGGQANHDTRYFVRRWPMKAGTAGPPVDLPVGSDSVMALAPLPDGRVAYATGEPTWGVITGAGQRTLQHAAPVSDFRNNRKGFTLSPDGARVRFAYEFAGVAPAAFDVRHRSFIPADAPGLRSARLDAPGLSVTDWEGVGHPKRNGQPIALADQEDSRSLALLAGPGDKSAGFVLGTGWNLRAYATDGRELWMQPAPGVVWAVNASADGRWVVAAYGDGTLRWHRATDGVEQLTFFPHPDRKRWILWTPSGFYEASPGAEDLIGWHINRGRDQAAEFFPASRFRSTFHRPDVIEALLDTGDEASAIARANAETGRRTTRTDITSTLPPVVDLVSPVEGERFAQPKVQVRYRVRTAADAPVTAIKVLVDGRPLEEARGLKPAARTESADGREFTLDLTLPGRDLTLAVVAENRHGSSEAKSLRLAWAGQAPNVLRPRLYVLAIGVAKYDDATLKLAFPVKDAEDVAVAFRAQTGLYREVVVKLLRNPSAPEFLDGLDWLRDEVTDRDVAAFFYAGHGMNDRDNDFYFLTREAVPERLRRSAVPYLEVKKTLGALPGKVLAFIDACHSGNAQVGRRGMSDINAVANELASAENGVVVFTSSTGRQFSLEDAAWGNGAFSKALVEGLNGEADLIADGKVTIAELEAWLADRVKTLTGNRQTPTTTRPPAIADFPIAVRR